MKLLAIDTSTEAMSVAVMRDDTGAAQVWQHSGTGGAQASLHLIATVQRLMGEAGLKFSELDAVCFGAGPGSFTGLRTACSVAQGLGFGAGVPLVPVNSLQAVAEQARWLHCPESPAGEILVALDARMDEMYVGRWSFARGVDGVQWTAPQDSHLVRPEALDLPALPSHVTVLAGNAHAVYGDRMGVAPAHVAVVQALPTATAMLRLAPGLMAGGHAVPAEQALPSYVRDKVAQTTQERADARAAAARPNVAVRAA